MSGADSHSRSFATVVLTGNPNCGKTTVFNALTGLRAKVANYAGVTVERKEGRLRGRPDVHLLDLPGTYSLSPQSLDEQIARDVLFHRLPGVPPPDLVVVVVDASNLHRNLYYTTQVIELGYPTLIALNMMDVAADSGRQIDVANLSQQLGVPLIPLVASKGQGLTDLRTAILDLILKPDPHRNPAFCELPPTMRQEAANLAQQLSQRPTNHRIRTDAEALLLLSDDRAWEVFAPELQRQVLDARQRLESAGVNWRSAAIEGRFACIASIQSQATVELKPMGETISDRLDRVLTHSVWGLVIFFGLILVMFQSIFVFAQWPMNVLDAGISRLGVWLGQVLAPGALHSLLVDGVIAGVGAVVVFLPQICLLFLFIGLLEDTGYMARAAFIMDRFMSKVGLHGKSFIPLLSSFACAIPGIMATRTIESRNDRLATILVAPLISCSARLPVYTLLISACIPDQRIWGLFRLQGLTLLSMYLLGILAALGMAYVFKRTFLKGTPPLLIMELPAYKRPGFKALVRHMWDRARVFLRQAGTVILGFNILLWFLSSYPHSQEVDRKYEARRQSVGVARTSTQADAPTLNGERDRQTRWAEIDRAEAAEKLQRSFAGRLGRFVEPVIAPLGFDWKIGVGIIGSFTAREIFVSTMSTVYSVGRVDDPTVAVKSLALTLGEQKRPDGSLLFTPLTGITLMVFYVFALQCVSTVAIVRRETNSWRWPLFQWVYMGLLAWVASFLTYQGGRLLGWS